VRRNANSVRRQPTRRVLRNPSVALLTRIEAADASRSERTTRNEKSKFLNPSPELGTIDYQETVKTTPLLQDEHGSALSTAKTVTV